MLSKYYVAVIVGSSLGVLLFIMAPAISPFLPKLRSTENLALVGRFTQADLPLSIQQQISLGLTTIAPDGSAAPALASSWETKDDGKTYIFHLAEGRVWQDGTPIKSSDIQYNFRDTKIEYPDDNTVVIRLNDPFAPLPVVVSRPVFKKGLLGAGLYKVFRLERNGSILESITLIPTETKSNLPKIKYLFYSSEQQARTAFKLGLVKSVVDIQDVADISSWPGVKLETRARLDRYVGVFFNNADPNFAGAGGKNFRLALAYAIDKSRYTDRAYGPLNPTSWANNTEVKKYDYDLEHSKELLPKTKLNPIRISTIPAYLETAEEIKKDWEKLGLQIDLVVRSEIDENFSVLVVAQAIPTDPDQYNLWHSTQGTNLTHLSSPRIDKLLEDGRKTLNRAERKKIYLDFQKFLVEDVPVVFLYHPLSHTLVRE